MIPLPLAEVEPLGELRAEPWAEEITGLQVDSRRIEEGDLFVAVNETARDFVSHAFARGAVAALVPEDAFAALAALGGAVRDRSGARFVGITGSYGKTTTKDVLAALCAPHARTVAAESSYNNEIGVPLTLCRLEPDTEVCILELSMRGPDQIAALSSFARPQIGAITNIGPVHLELLGSLEAIARAKAELLGFVEQAVLPEEPLLEPFVPDGLPVRRFTREDVVSFEDGRGVFRVDGRELELELNLPQRHNAVNALVALNLYAALGLPLDRAQEGAGAIAFSPWHGQELPLPGGGLLIADCWNANPISTRAALEHQARVAGGRRRVAVLGGMAELGPDAPRWHREVGEEAARLGVAELIAVGELARGYLDGADAVRTHLAESAAEAVDVLRAILQPGDVVLVKGSRSVGLEAVAENIAQVSA
ncbi:MAG: UDP-N-acetylmuramoyl-tripeptide--D-alanyl-D-alanine ligase [Gaiellaceae bacterium]